MDDAPPEDSARKARYDAAIERYRALGDDGEPALVKAALAEAASLVDRAAEPRRFAVLRYLFAQWSDGNDPLATIAACADALDIERADTDDAHVPELRAWCREAVARALDGVNPGAAEDAEPAIASLERIAEALTANGLYGLARLYEWRTVGDPHANWSRRVELLARHVGAREAGSAAEAQAKNLLAVAEAEEPNADFALAMERRIAAHEAVLASLEPATPVHVDTAIQLGTALVDRVLGDPAANGRAAEAVLRPALEAARGLGSARHAGQAAALLGRIQVFKEKPLTRERLQAGLALYAEAREAGAGAGLRALVASADKGIALAWLEALEQGDGAAYEPFLAACRAAAATFDAMPGYADEVRKLLQMQADAAIAAGRHADAIQPLEQAIERVRADAARATSRAGRLELVWRLRDSAALAAFCHAAAGDAHAACVALERGKGLFWSGDAAAGGSSPPGWSGDWNAIVPCGGAVVVPTFAGPEGMAIVATRAGEGDAVVDTVRLDGFGVEAVRALVQGERTDALGGWLLAYLARADHPEAFRDAIERVGGELGRRLVAPIAARLEARGIGLAGRDGVERCPEIVWLPQGRSGALPLRAAWTEDGADGKHWFVDRFALRFAPSLAHLERAARAAAPADTAPASGRRVAFADPTGDLPFAAIEAAWLAEAMPDLEVLAGPAATAPALLERLHGTRHLHVAGHGTFDIDDPFRSALLLAGLERGAPREVVLSACETAVTRVTSLADELLGFPAALLAHGVGSVLASTWPVDDVATAFLMRAWHAARTAADRPSDAEALRRAQVAVRDLRSRDVVRELQRLVAREDPIGPIAAAASEEFARDDPDARPFAGPDAWAAFSLWGDGVPTQV